MEKSFEFLKIKILHKEDIRRVDFIFTCGGDGTLLYLIKELNGLGFKKKIFSFNFGHAGFLCQFSKKDLLDVLIKSYKVKMNKYEAF